MLSVFGTGERNAIRLVRLFHPDYAAAPKSEIRAARLTQADAELIVAREHGFETFDAFGTYIEALREQRVSRAVRARVRGDQGGRPRAPERAAGASPAPAQRGGHQRQPAAAARDVLRPHRDGARTCSPPVPIPTCRTTRAGPRCIRPPTRTRPAIRPRRSPCWTLCSRPGPRLSPKPMATAARRSPWRCSGAIACSPNGLATPVVAPSNLRVAAGLGRVDLMEQFFDGQTTAAGGRLASRIPPAALRLSALAAERRCGAKFSPRR